LNRDGTDTVHAVHVDVLCHVVGHKGRARDIVANLRVHVVEIVIIIVVAVAAVTDAVAVAVAVAVIEGELEIARIAVTIAIAAVDIGIEQWLIAGFAFARHGVIVAIVRNIVVVFALMVGEIVDSMWINSEIAKVVTCTRAMVCSANIVACESRVEPRRIDAAHQSRIGVRHLPGQYRHAFIDAVIVMRPQCQRKVIRAIIEVERERDEQLQSVAGVLRFDECLRNSNARIGARQSDRFHGF